MAARFWKKPLIVLGVFLALWIGVKYVFTLIFPFLFGLLLALGAEPLVRFAQTGLKLRRGAAAGIGVSVTLVLLCGILMLLGALVVKELGQVAQAVPDLGETAQQGITELRNFLVNAAQRTPAGVRPMLTNTVNAFFADGSGLMQSLSQKVPQVISSVISWVPDGALSIGTAVLSGYMVSARLPKLRSQIAGRLPRSWKERYLPMLQQVRKALGGWLKAQAKLAAVTYTIVALGFWLLKIENGFLWAAVVALVDAVPVLGTGTVLVPWAVVCLLQGDQLLAIGILGIFGVALTTRTVLEPRLVGKHIGLDPLVTLLALYLGWRLWGIAGMVLSPLIATAAKAATGYKDGTNF